MDVLLNIGDTLVIVVTGTYGASAASNLADAFAALLGGEGFLVVSDSGLPTSTLGIDASLLPGATYQATLTLSLAMPMTANQARQAITFAAVQVMGATPTSVAIPTINGQATGEVAQAAPTSVASDLGSSVASGISGLGTALGNALAGIGGGAQKALAPTVNTVAVVLVVAVIGLVLIARSGAVHVNV